MEISGGGTVVESIKNGDKELEIAAGAVIFNNSHTALLGSTVVLIVEVTHTHRVRTQGCLGGSCSCNENGRGCRSQRA